jgi:Ca2+-binding EF-hand superfamily protein
VSRTQGVDVESLFRAYDPKLTGSVRRTELLEVLSKLGMYILEQVRDACLVLVLLVCVVSHDL